MLVMLVWGIGAVAACALFSWAKRLERAAAGWDEDEAPEVEIVLGRSDQGITPASFKRAMSSHEQPIS
jgi:hypothetical protein